MVTPGLSPEQLFQELYRDLKVLAARHVHRFDGNLSLSPTAVVHEAWLRVAARPRTQFGDHAQFLAYASRAMRAVVVDYAREQGAVKRGGEFHFTGITDGHGAPPPRQDLDLVALGDALDALGAVDPRLAEVVDLHFFCGFSFKEIADGRGQSERTVLRDWRKARLFLGDALAKDRLS